MLDRRFDDSGGTRKWAQRWVRLVGTGEHSVTKELAFWQKHSPNYDLYGSSILSTSQIYDGCVRCEGYNEPKSGEKNFERIRSL
jgi:hypothetical protein